MLPTLQIGPLALPAPELALIISIYIGLYLMETWLKQEDIPVDIYANLILFGLAAYLLGGRLGFIAVHLPAFAGNPADIFSRNLDLFDPFFGFAFASLLIAVISQRAKCPSGTLFTALAIFGSVLLLGFDVSQIASGKAYGSTSNLPWAITLWAAQRHPAQIYQLLLDLLFCIIWLVAVFKGRLGNVSIVWLFLLACASRFFVEAFRAEGDYLPGGWRLNQVWQLAGTLLAAYVISHLHNSSKTSFQKDNSHG